MTLRQRVRIFQGSLLQVLKTALEDDDDTISHYAAIATLSLLAQAINRADDMGAFDDDLSEVREEEPAEG